MQYEGTLYRPPSEARSLIIQVTIGCAHNRCTFCNMYREKKFRIRTKEEIMRDLDECHAVYGPYVRRVTESRRPPALSPAALEVLTIIAYRQPVTRAFIDQLRGVDSSNTVSSLAEKGLIEEAGRLDVPGKPMLFRTTDQFLRSFSLASIEDLPALPALEENEQMELNMDGTLHETPPGEQLRFLNGEPVPPETE